MIIINGIMISFQLNSKFIVQIYFTNFYFVISIFLIRNFNINNNSTEVHYK